MRLVKCNWSSDCCGVSETIGDLTHTRTHALAMRTIGRLWVFTGEKIWIPNHFRVTSNRPSRDQFDVLTYATTKAWDFQFPYISKGAMNFYQLSERTVLKCYWPEPNITAQYINPAYIWKITDRRLSGSPEYMTVWNVIGTQPLIEQLFQ